MNISSIDALTILTELREQARAGTNRSARVYTNSVSAYAVEVHPVGDEDPTHAPPLRRLLHELHAPISALAEENLVSLSADLHIFDALRKLEDEEARLAIVQETKDTILGVVSKAVLEDLLCQAQLARNGTPKTHIDASNPTVSAVMGRNISIETSDASVLEVLDRMTVGACPFVVIVNELGHPYCVLDPLQIVSSLSAAREALEYMKTDKLRPKPRAKKFSVA